MAKMCPIELNCGKFWNYISYIYLSFKESFYLKFLLIFLIALRHIASHRSTRRAQHVADPNIEIEYMTKLS